MTESDHQKALITWARLSVGRYPDLKYLYSIPNGGKRHIATAARMKAEGARVGVSDLHLPIPRGMFHGLWIEMKSVKGRLSPEQSEWLDAMKGYGHAAYVCRSWDEARTVLTMYLSQ